MNKHPDDDSSAFLSPGRNMEVYEALSEALTELRQGLCVYDAHSRKILYANDGFSKLFGYGPDEIAALATVLFLVIPEKRGELDALMSLQSGNGQAVKSLDTVAVKKNGDIFAVRICFKMVECQCHQLLMLFADITAEKKMQLPARPQEQEEDARVQKNGDNVVVMDNNYVI